MHNDMRNLRKTILWVGGVALLLPGCTRAGKTAAPSMVSATSVATTNACARVHANGAARLGQTRASSAIALAKEQTPGGSGHVIAYVADADEPALRTIDVDEHKE